MSSITFETANENQLTVQEYVIYAGIKEQVEKFLKNSRIKETLADYERNLRGLSLDLTIKYTIEK